MPKDKDYFLSVDVQLLATSSTRDTDARKRNMAWGEICKVLAVRTDILGQQLPQEDLLALLGTPDRTRHAGVGEVWEYDWFGRHGPNEYQSTTPFMIVDGMVTGLASDD